MREINLAVALLPRQFGKAIVLREFEGLSYDEIAARTGTTLGTVKSRIARGRIRMQEYLQPLIA